MSHPLLAATEYGGDSGLPLLVLAPSLGTSASTLWSTTAHHLTSRFHVIGWDLPGHGTNRQIPDGGFTVADLATGVLALVERIQNKRGDHGAPFYFAGDSIGGAVGQQLLLEAPDRLHSVALLCTAARFGEPAVWHERAALVRGSGTEALVDSSAERWFPEHFRADHPDVANRLLGALCGTDPSGYAAACDALATFDVRDRLDQITLPVLVISGECDVAAPVKEGRLIAESIPSGRLVVLAGVGHLAPAEAPKEVARLLCEHFAESTRPVTRPRSATSHSEGMQVRRQVLGDDHVDQAIAGTTAFTAEFQDLITRYAWGEIWTRTGLDRRSRSMITLTAMIARGHHEELAMHVRAARRNGLSREEIKEVIMHNAIYCGVPDANTAFKIAQPVLDDFDAEESTDE